MRFIALLGLMSLLLLAAVSAACPIDIQATTTQQLYNEVPQLNADLQTCPSTVPSALNFVTKNGVIHLQTAMNAGGTTDIGLSIQNTRIMSVTQGVPANPSIVMKMDENSMNAILSSNNQLAAILSLYRAKRISLSSPQFFTNLKLSVAKPFVKWFAPRQSEKPKGCFETWLPGHQGYAQNKQLWDSYSADTTGVCQSDKPVSCTHNIQLSTGGRPYYLCWY